MGSHKKLPGITVFRSEDTVSGNATPSGSQQEQQELDSIPCSQLPPRPQNVYRNNSQDSGSESMVVGDEDTIQQQQQQVLELQQKLAAARVRELKRSHSSRSPPSSSPSSPNGDEGRIRGKVVPAEGEYYF